MSTFETVAQHIIRADPRWSAAYIHTMVPTAPVKKLAHGSTITLMAKDATPQSGALVLTFDEAAQLVSAAWGQEYSPNFSTLDQARHFLASPSCAAARLVELAPSVRGQPGYWNAHDRNGDGVACEPIPKWKTLNRY